MSNKQKLLTIFTGIIGFSFYFIAIAFKSIPFELLNINTSELPTIVQMTYNIVYELLMVLFLIFLFKKDFINNFKDYIKHANEYIAKYIKYWFLTLGLMCISNLIIISFTSQVAGNEQEVRQLLDFHPIYTFILSVFLAPYLEELIFRKSIRNIIKWDWLFIIVSGFIFGSVHLLGNVSTWTDLLYVVPYGLPGCIFAYTLVKSNNIMVPISLHTIHNGILISMQILLAILT